MSAPNSKPTKPCDLEQLMGILPLNISDAVRWAYARYQHPMRPDELDDLSQQILLLLLEDDCRRLGSFRCHSSFKTWLQAVVNHYVSNYLRRRKQNENLDEVDPDSLSYLPSQDEEVDAAEKQKLLLKAIGKLNEQELLLYQLYFVYELEASRIAASLKTEVRDIYKRKQTLVLKLGRLVRDLQRH